MIPAVFLDRDGVINSIIYEPDGKLMSPTTLDQLKLLPSVEEGIPLFHLLGYKVIVITNQPGVALGYLKPEALANIHSFLTQKLKLDAIYCCPHHPSVSGPCTCRKPLPGLIEQAALEHNLDISRCIMVGDNLSDIECGNRAGVAKTFRIGTLRADILELQHQKNCFPDYTVANLPEVAAVLNSLQ